MDEGGDNYIDRYMNVYDVSEAATSAYAGVVTGGVLGGDTGVEGKPGTEAEAAVEAAAAVVAVAEKTEEVMNPMGVSSGEFVSVLIKAIQELSAKVTALENA